MGELIRNTLYNDSSLVAYYPMNGNSIDVRNGNNGTDSNVSYTQPSGKFSQGLSLTGSSSWVTLPNLGSTVSGSSARSVSLWVLKGASSSIKTLTAWNANTSITEHSFIMHTNVNGAGDIYVAFNNNDYYTGTGKTSTTTWTHVVLTYDGGTLSTGTVHIYINGVAQSLTKAGVGTGSANTDNLNYRIGVDTLDVTRSFDGSIDDVAIFSKSLSQNEVSNLFAERNRFVNTGLRPKPFAPGLAR